MCKLIYIIIIYVCDQTRIRYFVLFGVGFWRFCSTKTLAGTDNMGCHNIRSTLLLIRSVFVRSVCVGQLCWMHFFNLIVVRSKIDKGCIITSFYCSIIIKVNVRSATSFDFLCGDAETLLNFSENIVLHLGTFL